MQRRSCRVQDCSCGAMIPLGKLPDHAVGQANFGSQGAKPPAKIPSQGCLHGNSRIEYCSSRGVWVVDLPRRRQALYPALIWDVNYGTSFDAQSSRERQSNGQRTGRFTYNIEPALSPLMIRDLSARRQTCNSPLQRTQLPVARLWSATVDSRALFGVISQGNVEGCRTQSTCNFAGRRSAGMRGCYNG